FLLLLRGRRRPAGHAPALPGCRVPPARRAIQTSAELVLRPARASVPTERRRAGPKGRARRSPRASCETAEARRNRTIERSAEAALRLLRRRAPSIGA